MMKWIIFLIYISPCNALETYICQLNSYECILISDPEPMRNLFISPESLEIFGEEYDGVEDQEIYLSEDKIIVE